MAPGGTGGVPEASFSAALDARIAASLDGPRFARLVTALTGVYHRDAPGADGPQNDAISEDCVARRVRPVLLAILHGPDMSWPTIARRYEIKGVPSGRLAQYHEELRQVLSDEPDGLRPAYARRPIRTIEDCLVYLAGTPTTRDAPPRHAGMTASERRAVLAVKRFSEKARDEAANAQRDLVVKLIRSGESLSNIAESLGRSYHYVERCVRPGSQGPRLDLKLVLGEPATKRLRACVPADKLPQQATLLDVVVALLQQHHLSKEVLADALGVSARTLSRAADTGIFGDAFEKRPSPPLKQPAQRSDPKPLPDDIDRIDRQWMRPYGVAPALAKLWESEGILSVEGGPWAAERFLPEHYRWIKEHFPGCAPEAVRKSIDKGFKLKTGRKIPIPGLPHALTDEEKAVVLPENLPPLWSRPRT